MNRLFLHRRLALGAAAGLATGVLVSCNAIFGISPGVGTGGAPGASSSSATASSSSSGATGGASSSSSTGATSSSSSTGATSNSSSSGSSGAGGADAGPLKCDGTDPGGVNGNTALWAASAFSAVGMGAGLRTDGSIVLAGTFSGTNTVFGSSPLPFTDAGGFPSDVFVTRYLNGTNHTPPPFLGPAQVGLLTQEGYINTGFLMAVDAQGRTAIAGNFEGTFTIAGTTLTAQVDPVDATYPDSLDGFVAFFDASWNPLWPPKRLGSVLNDSADGVAIDSQGNVLVVLVSRGSSTASYTMDAGCGPVTAPVTQNANPVFVTKIGLTGACAWSDTFTVDNGFMDANNNGFGLGLTVDPNDDAILVGGAVPAYSIIGQGALGLDPYYQHAFAAKLEGADGSVTWRHAYEDPNMNPDGNTQSFFAVATDPCGNIVAGGGYDGGATFGSLPSLQAPQDAGVTVVEGMLVKLDPSGTPLWQDAFTGVGWTGVTAIQINQASDIALVGILQDAVGSAGIDFLGTMLLPPQPLNPGQVDFYVAKLKGDGSLRWVQRHGGPGYDAAFAVALDDAGHLVATGSFSSPITFGPGVTLTPGATDFYAVEFGP